jgi:hypothetical protein
MTIRIVVTPVGGGKFDAVVCGVVLCRSRTPFLDAARALLAAGHDSDTAIEMWHAGAKDCSLKSTIGAAAKLRVEESNFGLPRFRSWVPGPDLRISWHVEPQTPAELSGVARQPSPFPTEI